MSSANPQGLQSFPEALMNREAWLEPFDWYREMRDRAPVRYDEARGTWDVFRYDDAKTVLDDPEQFSVSPRYATGFQEPDGMGQGLILDTMLFQDPPRHDELRSVVDEAFQPRAIQELEPRLRELTTDLLDDALADGRTELEVVDDLAYPLPVIVIAELLGIPTDDREQFKTWSDTLVAAADSSEDTEAFMKDQQQTQQEMAMYFMELIGNRRENPKDDLISRIANTEREGGSTLSQEEALGMCILLLIAGNITTTNLITNAVRCFATHDVFSAQSETVSLSSAIEEALRYRSPVQAMTRVAKTDTTVHGERIDEGDRLVVWLGSANRDERQFDDADSFLPNRTPNQHVGFGHGTHYCLGAPLARLEAKVALSKLTDRLDEVELVDTELQPTRSSFIYGVDSLPIRFTSND